MSFLKNQKSKSNQKWKKVAIFSALFLVLILLSNSLRSVYGKKDIAEKMLTNMNEEKIKLEQRKGVLQKSLANLETKEGMKFEMRKKLNMAEVGESVAIIVDKNSSDSPNFETSSVWQKIKSFMFGLFE